MLPPTNNLPPDFEKMRPADDQFQNQVLQNFPQNIEVPQKTSFFEKTKNQFQSVIFSVKEKLHPQQQQVQMGVVSLKQESTSGLQWFHYFLISKKEMVAFLEQVSTLLSSGIRLVDSLVIMKQQSESFATKKLLAKLIEDVRNGALLSQAMALHPQLFPEKWISLVRAGEKSGQLEQILLDLSEDEQEQQQLMSALKGAMAYPVFVIVLTSVLVVYMLVVVVPEISDIYAKMHQKLPAPTLFIIALSEFLQQSYLVLLALIVGIIALLKTSAHYLQMVRNAMDWLKLRIPVLGPLKQKQNIAIFSGNMALLLRSGVLVVDALRIVGDVVPSPLYKQEFLRILDGVTKGKRISQEMGLINLQKEEFIKNFFFPLNVSQMIRIGEETGTLANLLEKMKKNYSNQIHLTVKTFSSLLEPIMIILVGVMVGGILLAVILPFFSMQA